MKTPMQRYGKSDELQRTRAREFVDTFYDLKKKNLLTDVTIETLCQRFLVRPIENANDFDIVINQLKAIKKWLNKREGVPKNGD